MVNGLWNNYPADLTGEGALQPIDGSYPLLDLLSKTAYQAYSMRKLRTAYSGSAIQIRRSSDNTTLDVGFTAAGLLNTAAIVSFVGANSAYVAKWYDQSGNARDMVQASNGYQPRIVNAGTLCTMAGVPAWEKPTNGDNLYLNHTSPGLKTLIESTGVSMVDVHQDKVNAVWYAESTQTGAYTNFKFIMSNATPPYVSPYVYTAGSSDNSGDGPPNFLTTAVNEVHSDIFVKPSTPGCSLYRDGALKATRLTWAPVIPAMTVAAFGGIKGNAGLGVSEQYGGKFSEHLMLNGVVTADDIARIKLSQSSYFTF